MPVTIRDLATLGEFQECCNIQEETWGKGFVDRVPAAILHVSQMMGGVTAGAFDASDRMLGFVFGLTGVRNGRLAHWSDMLAVRPEARGQNIGQRLKFFQRDKVREIGVDVMFWTFDPLVARNAHFNLNALGARVDEYVPDMYGTNTGSALLGTLPTDRIIARWDLEKGAANDVLKKEPQNALAPLLNPESADALPALDESAFESTRLRVQIPRDTSVASREDEDRLLTWRLFVRRAFQRAIEEGYQVQGFVAATDKPDAALPYYTFARK